MKFSAVHLKTATVKGALLIIASELLFASMAAVIKQLSSELSSAQIVFFRNSLAILILLPLLMHQGGLQHLRTRYLGLHLLRGLSGFAAMYGFFYIIAHMPLAEAALVKLTGPFFLPLIAWLWLSESISKRTLLAIGLGFVGVIFILRPGTGAFEPLALIGLLSAAFAAFAKVCIRRMGPEESSTRIVFYFALFSTLASAVPLGWAWQPLSGDLWPWILALTLFAVGGQLLMTRAYQIANPGQIGPYVYSSVIFAGLYGYWFWGEALLLSTLIGTLIIFAAGWINLRSGSSARAEPGPKAKG